MNVLINVTYLTVVFASRLIQQIIYSAEQLYFLNRQRAKFNLSVDIPAQFFKILNHFKCLMHYRNNISFKTSFYYLKIALCLFFLLYTYLIYQFPFNK